MYLYNTLFTEKFQVFISLKNTVYYSCVLCNFYAIFIKIKFIKGFLKKFLVKSNKNRRFLGCCTIHNMMLNGCTIDKKVCVRYNILKKGVCLCVL